MGERHFSVEEAAEILGCGQSTVYRMLTEGWLKRPSGWVKMNGSARVAEKSVFQLMIFDCLSHFPTKTLKEFKNGRKNFSRLFSQIDAPERFSKVEETGATPEIASLSVLQKNNEERRCLHHDFAAEHQFSFGWIARQLVKGDPALRDDLVQEMSLAVLQYGKPACCEYLLQLAENRAIDYLRYEERRGMMSLGEAQQQGDTFEAKMATLKGLIETLVTRGVPREWIDEVLGERAEDESGMGLAVAV
jgi:DNA-directed RNA polymerase specialized sigma24 family protein